MKYTDCFEKVCTHKTLEPQVTCEFCIDSEPATVKLVTTCCGVVHVCEQAAEYISRKGHCILPSGMPSEFYRCTCTTEDMCAPCDAKADAENAAIWASADDAYFSRLEAYISA